MNQKVIDALAKVVNVSPSDLAVAIENEEADLKISITKTFTDNEWEQYEENLAKEQEKKYFDAKEVGERQAIRDMKEEIGLDYLGKGREDFISNFRNKVLEDAEKNPDERVKTLTADLEALRTSSQQEIDGLKSQIDEKTNAYKSLSINQELSSHIPDKLNGVSKKDAMTILKSEYSFDRDEDGNEIVKKGNEVIKNKSRVPIGWSDVIKDSLVERNWYATPDGRGQGKKPPKSSGFKTMAEIEEHLESESINPKSQEARAIIIQAGKDNPDLDFSV